MPGLWDQGRMSQTPPDPDTVRQTLEAALADCRTASTATADDRKPVELDQTAVGRLTRMDAMQRQAMAQATERQRQTQMARLTAALERLDAGDYGYCTSCGEPIPEQRLAIDPAAPTCVGCMRGG